MIDTAKVQSRRWAGIWWVLPALVLVGVLVYIPLEENFRLSFTSYSPFKESEWVGFDNYVRLWNDPVFWTSLRNNIAYAVVSVIVQVGGGLVLASLLEQFVVPRIRGLLRTVYFLPMTISITVAGMLFTFMYNPEIGLIGEFARLVGLPELAINWLGNSETAIWAIIAMSQWQSIGYIAVLFTVAIQRIPKELFESAELDGASKIRSFFTVTVPLVREMTGLLTIVTVANAFLVFTEVIVMTNGGPNNSSHVLGTWLYKSAFFNSEPGYANTIAVVIFLISLVMAIAQLAYTRKKRVEM